MLATCLSIRVLCGVSLKASFAQVVSELVHKLLHLRRSSAALLVVDRALPHELSFGRRTHHMLEGSEGGLPPARKSSTSWCKHLSSWHSGFRSNLTQIHNNPPIELWQQWWDASQALYGPTTAAQCESTPHNTTPIFEIACHPPIPPSQ